jgi:hypothetical protein
MIPYLLAVVGGYLLGDSMKDSQTFAEGGDIDDDEEIIDEASLLRKAYNQEEDIDMMGTEITAKWEYQIDGHDVFIEAKFKYEPDADEGHVYYYYSGDIYAEIDNKYVDVPEDLYDEISEYLKDILNEAASNDDY